MKQKTVGALSLDLLKSEKDNTHTATEQMQEQLGGFDYQLNLKVQDAKEKFPGDFYMTVLHKKERLMQNVIRTYFFPRWTCPTPDWDQIVYKYCKQDDCLEFMWVIPDKETCQYMKFNALSIPEEQRELLTFVLDFEDGILLKLAKKLNGESYNSPILESI